MFLGRFLLCSFCPTKSYLHIFFGKHLVCLYMDHFLVPFVVFFSVLVCTMGDKSLRTFNTLCLSFFPFSARPQVML